MRFAARCYRAHDPRWSFDPVSGEGARISGGRFNPKGKPALYLSLRFETAIGEGTQGFAHRIPPITLCEYDVDCDPIADLRTDAKRLALNVSSSDLDCEWMSLMIAGRPVPSHEVAALLEKDGFAGALIPSYFPGATRADVNLVLWGWGDALPVLVRVHDPDGRLPRDRANWD